MTHIRSEVRPGVQDDLGDTSPHPSRVPTAWFWIAVVSILLLLGTELVGSIRNESETMDESVYLASGYSYWKTRDFRLNPEHPPLTKLLQALPLLFLDLSLPSDQSKWRSDKVNEYSQMFVYGNRKPADTLLFAGRCVTIGCTLLFGLFLTLWCRSHFGDVAALFTLCLFAVDPNLIAHGRYITSDLLLSMTFFFASVSWYDWLQKRTWLGLLRTAVLFGITLATKYSALGLIPVFVVLYVLHRYRSQRQLRPQWQEVAIASSLICFTSFIIIWGSFGFISKPLLSDEVVTQRFNEQFGKLELSNVHGTEAFSPAAPTRRFSPATVQYIRWFGSTIPIPAHYFVLGIYKQGEHASRGHDTYLLGKLGKKGWWYYFPVAMLVKTPVAVQGLGLVCGILLLWQYRIKRKPIPFIWLFLLCTPLIYLIISCSGNLNLGIRYILTIYPFLYAFMGAILFGPHVIQRSKMWTFLALGLVSLAAVESLSTYPNYLPFFNILAGGPTDGPRYLLDSNLDWGQDLKKLAQFRAGQQNQPPLCLEYHGPAEPAYYGIHYQVLPPLRTEQAIARLSCEVAISANTLFSHPDTYRALLRRSPEKRIGYSIYIYEPRLERTSRQTFVSGKATPIN